jgi:N-acetylgalactosamine-6-sulfatase
VIAEGDEGVGRILSLLKELGIDDNTLVVFSSDNGPEATRDKKKHWFHGENAKSGFGGYFSVGETAGLVGQKRSLYAGGTRVPFIVRWPAVVPKGKVDETSVITAVDLLPTFLDAAGIEMPEDIEPDGESAFAAFKGEQFTRTKPIFWEWRGGMSKDYMWPSIGIRDGRWKLITNKELDRTELYDMENDWAETTDVADKNPDVVKDLTAKLNTWKATLPTEPKASCCSIERK